MAAKNVTVSTVSRLVGKAAGSTFANLRAGVGVTVLDPTGTNPDNLCGVVDTYTTLPWLFRSFITLDFSDIVALFSGATLYVWSYSKAAVFEAMIIVEGEQGDTVSLPGDWTDVNSKTTKLAEVLKADVTTGGWVAVTFTAAGTTYLQSKAGGTVRLCCMSKDDFDNNYYAARHSSAWFWYLPQEAGKEPYIQLANYLAVSSTKRVSGLRHVYRPGSYRLEATFGGISTTSEIAEKPARAKVQVPVEDKGEQKAAPLVTEIDVPAPVAPEIMALMQEMAKTEFPLTVDRPKPQNLWQQITPWKEEEGQTFGGEFGRVMTEGLREVEKLGTAIIDFWKDVYK